MTEHRDPHALLLLIQNGDSSAYDELYEQVRPKLYRHILGKYGSTLDESDAEDVIHNTMLNVWLCAHQYRGVSAKGWIYMIARSEALKMIKVKKRCLRFSDEDDDENDPSTVHERNFFLRDIGWEGKDSVEERVIRSRTIANLEESIEYLSSEDQELLRLRYKEECTFEDIGRHFKRTKVRAKQRHDGIIAKLLSLFKLD